MSAQRRFTREGIRLPAFRSARRPAVLFFLAAVWCLPVYWVLLASFSAPKHLLSGSLLPGSLTLSNYRYLFDNLAVGRFLANSAWVSVVATVVGALFSVTAGYGLSRTPFPGRRFFGQSVLLSYTVPKVLLVVPIFLILASVEMSNHTYGLLFPYIAFTMPFGIWLMKGFFDGLPAELEDAAAVDGASRLQTFVHVMLPLSVPGIAATAVFIFMFAWNDYLFALVLLNSENVMTFPRGVVSVLTGDHATVVQTAALMAASVLGSLPVVVVFAAAQRFFVQGLAAGAVKG
jgi:multiple sugar transport system permease protein